MSPRRLRHNCSAGLGPHGGYGHRELIVRINDNAAEIALVDVALVTDRVVGARALWKPETWPDRGTLPSMGTIIKDQLSLPMSAEELDADIDERARTMQY